MEDSDVDVNIKKIETESDNMYQSKQTMVKTKYDGGNDRSFYKTKSRSEKSEQIRQSLDKPSNSVEHQTSSNKQNMTPIEMRRLEEINGRSTRLVFKHIWELPKVQDILDLCPDILCVVEAKFRAPSCFCVFTDNKEKDRAEKYLDGLTFRNGFISLDSRRPMVPVDTSNLHNTREPKTLAVHGIGREVTSNDLRRAFPGAKDVKIAQRGGSAFLTYEDDQTCSLAFTASEDIRVRGYKVQVLFGHFISKNIKKSDGISFKPPTRNNHSVDSVSSPPRVARNNELITRSPLQSVTSTRTPRRNDLKSLLSALDGSGLRLDEVQLDYIRGGCDPGSGPDIRTAWMERLKASTENKLSRSSRMDLVDNIWNYFEDDADTQRKLRKGKEKLSRSTSREKSTSRRSTIRDTSVYQMEAKNEKREKRSYEERKNTCSSDRKSHKSSGNYEERKRSCSPDRKKQICRRIGYSTNRKRQRSWENERYKKINGDSRDSSAYSDIRVSSLKHCRRKIEYDSSSPSPPRVQTLGKCDSLDRKIDTKSGSMTTEEGRARKKSKLESTSRSSSRSNSDGDEEASKEKLNGDGDELATPFETKRKKTEKNCKTEMILSKSKMISKLRGKYFNSKSGKNVIEKVLKKYKRAKEKGRNKQREKEKIEKEDTFKSLRNLTEKEEYFALTNFMKVELERNECKSIAATVNQIIDAFLKEGLRYKDLQQEYLRQLTESPDSEVLRERLVNLLAGAGISNSSEICPNLAAGLVLDYLNSSPAIQTKLVKWRKSSVIINEKLEQLADEDQNKSETENSDPPTREKFISNQILAVAEGFPRMALVMAGRLADTSQMEEEKCKAMAAAMVAVWINYGFTYNEMEDIYARERKRDADASSDDVSFLGMRRLLHSRLRKKVDEGHEMPKKIGFSLLIDLTMFYFEKAT